MEYDPDKSGSSIEKVKANKITKKAEIYTNGIEATKKEDNKVESKFNKPLEIPKKNLLLKQATKEIKLNESIKIEKPIIIPRNQENKIVLTVEKPKIDLEPYRGTNANFAIESIRPKENKIEFKPDTNIANLTIEPAACKKEPYTNLKRQRVFIFAFESKHVPIYTQQSQDELVLKASGSKDSSEKELNNLNNSEKLIDMSMIKSKIAKTRGKGCKVVVFYENQEGQEVIHEIVNINDTANKQNNLNINNELSSITNNTEKTKENSKLSKKKSKTENYDYENETDITLLKEIREIDEKLKQNRECYSKVVDDNSTINTNRIRNSGFKKPSDLNLNKKGSDPNSIKEKLPFSPLINSEEIQLDLNTPPKNGINKTTNIDTQERNRLEKEKLLESLNTNSILDIDVVQKLNLIENFGDFSKTGLNKSKKKEFKVKDINNYNDEVYFNKTSFKRNKSLNNSKKNSRNNLDLPLFAKANEKESDRDTFFNDVDDKKEKKDEWKAFASYFKCS